MTEDLYKSNGKPEIFDSPLTNDNQRSLHTVCVELGLSEDTFEQLEFIARSLRDFETHGKCTLKSERQKIKDLEAVERAAKTLSRAILELDTIQCLSLSHALPPEGLRHTTRQHFSYPGASVTVGLEVIECELSYPLRGFRVGYIGTEAQRLAAAANSLSKTASTSRAASGGRISTSPYYAGHIGEILKVVRLDEGRETPMTVGRGGVFERLCEAVFVAAGVAISPAGPLRVFIQNRNAAANTPDDETF